MTGWRWMGIVLMLGLIPLAGWQVSSFAQEKKEDKKEEKKEEKKAEPKQEVKPSGDENKLEFKAFNEGAKPFYQTLKTTTKQTMTVMSQEVIQKQEQTFYIQWTPKTEKGGDLTVQQKIIGVNMKIDIGGNKIAYDSTEEKPGNNPMKEFFEALKTLELTLVLDPTSLAVKDVKGRDDFVKKLTDTNPQMTSLLQNILSKEAIMKMAQPTWAAIPNAAKKKGDTWSDKSVLDLGAIGKYNTDFKYTYEGRDKSKDKIAVAASLSYEAPGTDKKGLPFTILKDGTTLSSSEGTGSVLFDPEKGRIESSNMKMVLSGKLNIEVGNQKTEVTLSQEQTSEMTTSDVSPLPSTEKKKS